MRGWTHCWSWLAKTSPLSPPLSSTSATLPLLTDLNQLWQAVDSCRIEGRSFHLLYLGKKTLLKENGTFNSWAILIRGAWWLVEVSCTWHHYPPPICSLQKGMRESDSFCIERMSSKRGQLTEGNHPKKIGVQNKIYSLRRGEKICSDTAIASLIVKTQQLIFRVSPWGDSEVWWLKKPIDSKVTR